GWLTKEETEAVARDLGVSPREVTEMEQRLTAQDLSLDPDPSDDEDYAPSAYLPAPDADPADEIERVDWAANAHDRLDGAIERLDPRSPDILTRRSLTENKATRHEVAAEYQVSPERIRQIG